MAADDKKRETIRRNLKYERLAPSLLYRVVHQAVASYLVSPVRDRRVLQQCRQALELERENATNPQQQDNATYAIRSLDTFERSLNALPIGGINLERAPPYRPHIIEGVKVSIQPTVLIRVNRPRGAPLRGALIVDVAKGIEAKSDEAKQRATMAMTHSAILLHEHIANAVVTESEKSSAEHCLVFHTHRSELVASPTNYRRQLAVMEASCRTAYAMWKDVSPPPSFDSKFARFRD